MNGGESEMGQEGELSSVAYLLWQDGGAFKVWASSSITLTSCSLSANSAAVVRFPSERQLAVTVECGLLREGSCEWRRM